MLGVLDDFEWVCKYGDLELGLLKLVVDKLDSVLIGLGLVVFGVEGEDFDFVLYEVV